MDQNSTSPVRGLPDDWAHRELDRSQSTWDLTTIQVVGAAGAPSLVASVYLSQTYGFVSAFVGIVVGQLLLFLIALVIVKMSEQSQRRSTLENAAIFVGKFGAVVLGIFLLLDAFTQFMMGLSFSSSYAVKLLGGVNQPVQNQLIRFAVILSIASTLVVMRGIRAVRTICLWSFPVLAVISLVLVFHNLEIHRFPASFASILRCILVALGAGAAVIVDYPTFLRHSRSYRGALRAIAFIQILTFLVSLSGLFVGAKVLAAVTDAARLTQLPHAIHACIVVFLLLSTLCINATSIYSASIGWEVVAKFWSSPQEYFVIGLILTLLVPFAAGKLFVGMTNNITDSALVVLCAVLVPAVLVRLFRIRQTRLAEYIGYIMAWLGGVALATLDTLEVIRWGSAWGVIFGVCVSTAVALAARSASPQL